MKLPSAPQPASQSTAGVTVTPRPGDPADEGAALPQISVDEGMRYYTAILGHEPVLDPEAPDLMPSLRRAEEPPARSWADKFSRDVRDELARKLQMKLDRRPTWRELMDAMTLAAGRRIEEARRKLAERRDAA